MLNKLLQVSRAAFSSLRSSAERLPGWQTVATSRWRIVPLAVAGVAVLVVSGLFGDVVNRAPGPLRNLPGVQALIEVDPPTYERSVFGMNSPLSVAASADGRWLYVAEGTGERTVRRVSARDGETLAHLAPPLTQPGTRKPLSVAVAPDGVVYVVDRVRRTVDMYDVEDSWLGALPVPGEEHTWSPLSVDVDRAGRIYVTNTHEAGPVLTVYDADGHIEQTYATIEAGGAAVSFPNSVSVDPDGRLVIGDSNNSRLVLFDSATGATAVFGTLPTETLALPRGVALDSHGFSLVVDANDHSVSAWDFTQAPRARLFVFGEAGIEEGAFLFPNDIAIDRSGRIYIADRDNDRIQVWNY